MKAWRQFLAVVAAAVLVLGGSGCVTVPPDNALQAASTRDVQDQAWGEVKDLHATLERLDENRHPGMAALVEDLAEMIAAVEDIAGPHYDRIDLAALFSRNPDYWRAMTELDPADPTLLVLEAMAVAANGKVEEASDLLKLVRAGPLTEDELDRKLVLQRRTISQWRWSPPAARVRMVEGLPPAERWEPVKRVQRLYPDSTSAAAAVLRLRADLAGVSLQAQGEDQRMRDKILEAEPDAFELLEAKHPLLAAIISAKGGASDAAIRVAKMLTPDSNGVLNLSEEDWENLIADFVRMDLPEWALRASRLQMAQRGEAKPADIEAWRQLLPELIGEESANELLLAWENGAVPSTSLYATVPEPTGTTDRPMDPVVGGHYERMRRDATLIRDNTLPLGPERQAILLKRIVSARALGNVSEMEDAIAELATESVDPALLARYRLSLATLRGDVLAVRAGVAEVEQRDRRLLVSNFEVANAEIFAGDWAAAADAFAKGFANKNADRVRRGFAALHAFGAAQLAGENRMELVREAIEVVPPDAWVRTLLQTLLGEFDREQLLALADEGRSYIATGQRCEALFALAFAPGQTSAGRDADLKACFETGMVGYVEYEFARHYLSHLR